ncbi:hypothetical protein [Alkalibacillus haloalkaliphilus]|uniref:hypothetical protein n=1 Tax=Alkalibacillus haloalkaliphilus TaxID=94136 RepID=UPI0002FA8A3F|nr:hypothetical protein [Alkalibacillus haloalkaliphilus]
MEVQEDHEQSERQLQKSIEQIKDQNKTQGKNGLYSHSGINPYQTIINLIRHDLVDMSEKSIEKIIHPVIETVISSNQLIADKVNALRLVVFIKGHPISKKFDLTPYYHEVINNEEKVLIGRDDPFEKHSNNTLMFNYVMLKTLHQNDYAPIHILSQFNETNTFEKIEALKTVNEMASYGNELEQGNLLVLMQFVLSLCHSNNHDVRFWAVKALLLMITEETSDTILTQVSQMMDYDSAYIKSQVINKFDELMKMNKQITKLMVQKVSVDNHYVVRQRGLEYLNSM